MSRKEQEMVEQLTYDDPEKAKRRLDWEKSKGFKTGHFIIDAITPNKNLPPNIKNLSVRDLMDDLDKPEVVVQV